MSTTPQSVCCVTCEQPLLAGKRHPEIFAAQTIGWEPGQEVEWANSDLAGLLRYMREISDTIESLWTLVEVTREMKAKQRQDMTVAAPHAYLTNISEMAGMLSDMHYEAKRRLDRLLRHIATELRKEEAKDEED
jgi:hypothetical protein